MNPYFIALACFISFTAAWTAQGWRYGEQILDMKLEASGMALESATKARAKTITLQSKITALDAQKTKELARAKDEINRMRDSVRNGTGWLQLNASCAKLPRLSIDTGMGDGTPARLTDSAERNYYILREGIATCTKQVEVLQGWVKTVTQ